MTAEGLSFALFRFMITLAALAISPTPMSNRKGRESPRDCRRLQTMRTWSHSSLVSFLDGSWLELAPRRSPRSSARRYRGISLEVSVAEVGYYGARRCCISTYWGSDVQRMPCSVDEYPSGPGSRASRNPFPHRVTQRISETDRSSLSASTRRSGNRSPRPEVATSRLNVHLDIR